jgi:hypothetical protein
MDLMWLRTAVFYSSFAIAGTLVGLGSWYFQFTDYKAIKVVGMDRVPTEYVIDPVILVETIKSPGFAKKVSERTGLADLAFLLPAVNYGGQQKLTVRTLGTPPAAIELRLSMPTAELALTAMDAVGDEIASLQSARTHAFLNTLAKPAPLEQYAAGESRLAIGNEQAALSQLALNKALLETQIRTRTGQSIETSVLPPTGPTLLLVAGAVGALCVAILLKLLVNRTMFSGTSGIAEPAPAVKELSQVTPATGASPAPISNQPACSA